MLGRLSEPNKDFDPAIDGLQRPLRSTFRDFRFLRVYGSEGVYAGYGMGGIDAMDGSNSTSGINGVSGM